MSADPVWCCFFSSYLRTSCSWRDAQWCRCSRRTAGSSSPADCLSSFCQREPRHHDNPPHNHLAPTGWEETEVCWSVIYFKKRSLKHIKNYIKWHFNMNLNAKKTSERKTDWEKCEDGALPLRWTSRPSGWSSSWSCAWWPPARFSCVRSWTRWYDNPHWKTHHSQRERQSCYLRRDYGNHRLTCTGRSGRRPHLKECWCCS